MKKLQFLGLVWASSLLLGDPARAQTAGGSQLPAKPVQDGPAALADSAPQQQPGQTIDACWQAWLTKEGLVAGKNESNGDYLLVLNASERVQADPKSKQWLASRNAAFEIAEIAARQEMATSINTFIESDRSLAVRTFGQELASDNLQATAKTLSIADKVDVLTDAALDAEIKKFKPDWNGDNSSRDQKEQMLAQRANLRDNIAASARLYAAGAFTPVQCEGVDADGSYSVLVGLIWSPRLSRIAETIWNPAAVPPSTTPEAPLKDQLAAFKAEDPDWLAYTLGARVFTDEKGERVVVGFGAAPQTSMKSVDVDRARLRAEAAVQRFVGEKIVSESEEKSLLQNAETADEKTLVRDGSSFESTQQLYSKSMNLSGIVPVENWRGAHPWSGAKMQVVAVAWSRAWAADSRAMGAAMEKAEERMRNQGAVPTDASAPEASEAVGHAGAAVPVRSGAQSSTKGF